MKLKIFIPEYFKTNNFLEMKSRHAYTTWFKIEITSASFLKVSLHLEKSLQKPESRGFYHRHIGSEVTHDPIICQSSSTFDSSDKLSITLCHIGGLEFYLSFFDDLFCSTIQINEE